MMAELGVRELKIHASEIIRMVREKSMRYVVTYRGRPVAAIIPVEEIQTSLENDSSAWDELSCLGQQVSQNWSSEATSTEILSDMRR